MLVKQVKVDSERYIDLQNMLQVRCLSGLLTDAARCCKVCMLRIVIVLPVIACLHAVSLRRSFAAAHSQAQ
eukprot:COSAG01_NODE_2234_length_8097_cov_5.001500_11_plen_71_part_00